MKPPSDHDRRPAQGLRERKKARTRADIQRHALRLFREQGYDATTVEQIAEAAEVSPSTFFRYFPTKEDVVLYDALDPVLFAAFKAQPPGLSPIQAMRGAVRALFAALPESDLTEQRDRGALIFAVPELRMRVLDQIVSSFDLFAEIVAARVARPADDPDVRIFVGALFGALVAVLLPAAVEDPEVDYQELIDAALAQLEAGLPL
ncbi:MAG TPA: TetR family transcriptional regulator [Thermomicrobiaceae bacterium]|nr:TetR family transcriptional regulator [Thermomicrobiaceae bacterium]